MMVGEEMAAGKAAAGGKGEGAQGEAGTWEDKNGDEMATGKVTLEERATGKAALGGKGEGNRKGSQGAAGAREDEKEDAKSSGGSETSVGWDNDSNRESLEEWGWQGGQRQDSTSGDSGVWDDPPASEEGSWSSNGTQLGCKDTKKHDIMQELV